MIKVSTFSSILDGEMNSKETFSSRRELEEHPNYARFRSDLQDIAVNNRNLPLHRLILDKQ